MFSATHRHADSYLQAFAAGNACDGSLRQKWEPLAAVFAKTDFCVDADGKPR
jgi:hypothetical protein